MDGWWKKKRRNEGQEKNEERGKTKKEGRKERVREGREVVGAVHCSFLLLLFVDTLALEQGNHADAKTGWFLGCCGFFFILCVGRVVYVFFERRVG